MSADTHTNLAEAPHLRMELVELDKDNEIFSLDIDQSLSFQQYCLIREVLSERYDIPIKTPVLHEQKTGAGDAFAEIDCSAIRLSAEAAGHFFDEQNFGREVWNILFLNKNVVEFNTNPIPIERSSYRQ